MQKRFKTIAHTGIVEKIDQGQVMVRIQQQSACGHCHSKSYCSMSETSEKIIEVSVSDAGSYRLGQHVTLFLKESLGYRALMLGYIMPFLLLMFSLVVMINLTGNDGLSALVSVSLMAPYYALLYKFRANLRKKFVFRIGN